MAKTESKLTVDAPAAIADAPTPTPDTPASLAESSAPHTEAAATRDVLPSRVRVKSVPRQWDERRRCRWAFPTKSWTDLHVKQPSEGEILTEEQVSPAELAEIRADDQLLVETFG